MYRTSLLRLILCTSLTLISVNAHSFPLVLGQLSDRPKKDFKQLRPMVEYMASKLSHLGVTSGQVRLYSSLPELISAVKSGEVSWVTETAYSAAVLLNQADGILLALKWKGGTGSYHSVIYTHRESGINTLNDLAGKAVAFEHNTSFSSYYLPRNALEKEGLSFVALGKASDVVASDKVGFVFSRNEKNNALWTEKQIVSAGALSSRDWENEKRMPDSLKSNLKIIYRSQAYPRALELASPTLPKPLVTALRDELLSLNKDNAGKLLRAYEKTTQFQRIDDQVEPLLNEIYESSRSW